MENPIFKGMMPKQSSIVIGMVKSFDRLRYTATIIILPQLWELANVRQATSFAGGNMSIMSDLKADDVVLVALINDSIDDPIIIGRVWHHHMTVPTRAAGDSTITHASGTTINISDAGDVTIIPASGKKVYLGSGTGAAVVLDGDTVASHTHGPGSFMADGKPVTGSSAGSTSTVTASSTKTVAA